MNDYFMQKALEIAAISGNDIPVGAVIVKDNEIISKFHNEKEIRNDITAHAEILALKDAAKKLSDWHLNGCDLYVTLEPCPMCLWAIISSRIDNLYFGAYDNIYGGYSAFPDLYQKSNSKLCIKGGIMEKECTKLLDDYFARIR